MEHILTTAARYPTQIPTRDEFPEEERDAYDYQKSRTESWGKCPELVDGHPYGFQHFQAMLLVPGVASAISGRNGMGHAIRRHEGRPGFHSKADHKMVDLVLAFDDEYWALIAWVIQEAILEGVRIECIEALAAHRDVDLTNDELQVTEFIRAVRDGAMTDQIWNAMKKRLGSERGVVNYVSMVLCLLWHVRFCAAVGVPEMGRDEFRQMMAEYRNGTRKAEDANEYKRIMVAARQLGDKQKEYSF